jgi:tRNA A-37 threonylcarbamoyl transferase component Bud32
MVKVSLDRTNESFEITSYNGNSAEKETYQQSFHAEGAHTPSKWNFFREGDNHSYVGGSISYLEDCKNNLIISPCKSNRVINVKNAFILIRDSYVEISPISDIHRAINKGKKELSNREINYNIPVAVFERENVIEKNKDELKEELRQKYGINIDEISLIKGGTANNNRVYHLIDKYGKEYILKFRGRNKEKAELLPKITQEVIDYFPLNFHRKDNGNFTFEVGKELWGLEEFIRESNPRPRDINYFSLVGRHIGLLHNRFSNFFNRNKWIREVLSPTGSYTSESNFISLYLDLVNTETNIVLLPELEKIIENRLDTQIKNMPVTLIHGDLNWSNLIWKENNPKIIDSETIKISSRLNEFGPPLLFEGNMEKPKYIKNSLDAMINAYNLSNERPLSREETKILSFLLKYASLRNFVVRKIRRNVKEAYLDETIENLKFIEGDS